MITTRQARQARSDTYPASYVRVETGRFEFAHGRRPAGRGTWAFEIDGNLWWAPSNLLYSAARRLAQKEAGSRGLTVVTVAS